MKFRSFLILILCVTLLLCGCGKKQEITPTVATEPTEPPVPKLGLLLRQQEADEADASALQSAFQSMGYDVLLKDAKNDQSAQNNQVMELINAGCEILVVQPVMISGLDVLVNQVKTANIPLVLIDHQPEQSILDLYDKIAFIGADHTQAGSTQAQLLAALPKGGDINEDGAVSVLMIRGPEDHIDATTRAEEFLKLLPSEKYVVLDTVIGEWTQDGGRIAAAEMLKKYGPDIEVVVTSSYDMALGVIQATENGGWVPGQDLYILSVGVSTVAQPQLDTDAISGIAAPDNDTRMTAISAAVSALASGEAVEKITLVNYITIQ